MQDASINFGLAATGADRAWMPTRIRTDWDGIGYAGDRTIDDLGSQAGAWAVTHHLDDGLPDEVSFVAGLGTPELTAALAGRGPLPVPASFTASWSTSTANPGAGSAATASVVVPAGLAVGEWVFFVVSINLNTPTISTTATDLAIVAGPTVDGVTVQTVVYAREVNAAFAAAGGTYTFAWTAATHYTIVAASVGARDGLGDVVRMAFVDADQTGEPGAGVTSHTTPNVASDAASNAVITFWCRGTTAVATWTLPAGDTKVIEAVGASGSGDNVDVAIGITDTPAAAGSFTRTATTTSTSNATMGIAVFAIRTGASMSARAYFSPLRTDSPIYGIPRDISDVTLDVGLVTDSGPEYVRLFTGQMVDLPVPGQQAALSAISQQRLKLSALVQAPAVAGRYEGARADWVISYALAASQVYLSPPPQPGCRLWMPMHGSIHAFLPSDNGPLVSPLFYGPGGVGQDDQTFRTGPYHLGANFGYSNAAGTISSMANNGNNPPRFADGDPMVSQDGLRGKAEMWIFGHELAWNQAPAVSASLVPGFRFDQDNANGTFIRVGMNRNGVDTARPWIWINDGTTNNVFYYATAIPNDGQWHKLGYAWDLQAGNCKRWINVDGVVSTDNTSFAPSGFPATVAYNPASPGIQAQWPIAELQITAGAYANPDNHPWLFDIAFAPDVKMTPSLINLVNVAMTQPQEAWALIGAYAQAEQAMLRPDEQDVINYLGPAHWVKAAQQVIVDRYDTGTNAAPIPVFQDPTKIRNSVRVTYGLAQSSTRFIIVGTLSSELPFPPGATTFVLPLTTAGVELRGMTIAVNDGTGTQPTDTNYITLNTSVDGTGSYATATQATANVLSWHPGAALIEINNLTSANLYVANNNNWPGLAIAAKPHYVTSTFVLDSDDASILERGERSLAITSDVVQREVDARRLARNLKTNLMRPTVIIGDSTRGIPLAGDPRRQPGDLVTVHDAETGIDDGLWRVQSIEHAGDGAKFRQSAVVRRTLPIMVIGAGLIGRTIIGPDSTITDPELGL